MKYCIIENNKVVNRVAADSQESAEIGITAGQTALQDDTAQIGWELLDGVLTTPYVAPPTAEELDTKETKRIEDLTNQINQSIQQHIDSKAKSLGYDNINSIAKYMSVGNPFEQECLALSLWCANCWVTVKEIQVQFEANEIAEPTVDTVIAALPTYEGV